MRTARLSLHRAPCTFCLASTLGAVAAGCGGEPPATAIPQQVALALRIQREGAAALPAVPISTALPDGTFESHWPPDPMHGGGESLFHGVAISAGGLQWFLATPSVDTAVQFGCSSTTSEFESRLTKALREGDDEDALLALTVLVHLRAPRSIDTQWATLARLDHRHGGEPGWREVLAAIRTPFRPAAITAHLAEHAASGTPSQWFVRAAGLVRLNDQLPQLVALARGPNLDVALAAERAIDDLPGPPSDEALAQCLLGWQYDVYVRAGFDLADRNRALLEATIAGAEVPTDAYRAVGRMLARAWSTTAVPYLCASVGATAIVDGDMFTSIEQLATDAQWDLVDALPTKVRAEQYERAEQVRAAVRKRLGR